MDARPDEVRISLMSTVFADNPCKLTGGNKLRQLAVGAARRLSGATVGRGRIQLAKFDMSVANLGAEFEGARLVHLSDPHCGPTASQERLRRHVEIINLLDADFVVITGDFVTIGHRGYAKRVAEILGRLRAKVAKVACLGNHDYGLWHPSGLGRSRGLPEALSRHLNGAGIHVLRNTSRTFFRGEAAIQFVGVEDYWTPMFDPREAFDLVDVDTPTIALAHNPDAAIEMAAWKPDWILSGHTHGQATPASRFWDIVYPTRFKQFVAGRYHVGNRTRLYVNSGLGTTVDFWRGFSPEVTLFTLVREDAPLGASQGGRDRPVKVRDTLAYRQR